MPSSGSHLPVPLGRGLCHNFSAMRRCWFLLALTPALLQGQTRPGPSLPSPDSGRPQSRNEKADWPRIQTLPNGMVLVQTRPDWNYALKQKPFDWQQINTQPGAAIDLGTEPRASTCVVPLLEVPVNPNPDPKMPVLHPPQFKSESAEIVKGLPTCPSGRSK